MEASTSRMLLRPIQSFSRSRNNGGQFSVLNTNHLHCCSNGLSVIRCGGKKMDTVVKLKTKETKKRLRLMKGLSSDLSLFSEMGFSRDDGSSSSIEENNMFLELSRILIEKLEKLKEEKKQLKRKEKEEKKKAKALKKISKNRDSSDSSDSDSSDSSDSESEALVNVESLPEMNVVSLETNSTIAQTTVQKLGSNAAVVESFGERIDVCMGGKCKKFGAEALMKELDRKIEGAVVGCKCMGKCKNAPNVRISSKSNNQSTEGKVLTNPLYLGVGLEDVDLIVSNFLRKDKEMVAAA